VIIDTDLARLTAADLRAAELAARGLRHVGRTRSEPALAAVADAIVDALLAEQATRDAGRGRGTVRLTVPEFADADPDRALADRRGVIGYLLLVRDDPDERPAVRHLFADLAADLADPTETSLEHERARLGELWP